MSNLRWKLSPPRQERGDKEANGGSIPSDRSDPSDRHLIDICGTTFASINRPSRRANGKSAGIADHLRKA